MARLVVAAYSSRRLLTATYRQYMKIPEVCEIARVGIAKVGKGGTAREPARGRDPARSDSCLGERSRAARCPPPRARRERPHLATGRPSSRRRSPLYLPGAATRRPRVADPEGPRPDASGARGPRTR